MDAGDVEVEESREAAIGGRRGAATVSKSRFFTFTHGAGCNFQRFTRHPSWTRRDCPCCGGRRLGAAPLPHWEGSSSRSRRRSACRRGTTNQAVAAARRAIFMRAGSAAGGGTRCRQRRVRVRHPRGRRALPALARQGRRAARLPQRAGTTTTGRQGLGHRVAVRLPLPRLYGLDGRLTKATIGRIEGFKAKEHGLEKLPFAQAGVGGFAWPPHTGEQRRRSTTGWASRRRRRSARSRRPRGARQRRRRRRAAAAAARCVAPGLHVPVAHKGLADNLDFGSYTTQAAEPHAVVQSVGGRAERVGGAASYTYIGRT